MSPHRKEPIKASSAQKVHVFLPDECRCVCLPRGMAKGLDLAGCNLTTKTHKYDSFKFV